MINKLKYKFKSLFLPRVGEFIYIEGDNKRVSSAEIINFIYNNFIYNDFSRRHSFIGSFNININCSFMAMLYKYII